MSTPSLTVAPGGHAASHLYKPLLFRITWSSPFLCPVRFYFWRQWL